MSELIQEASEEGTSLAGVNVMLMGPTGTGKTHSIGTLIDAGIEVFYIGLESGLESLIGYYADRGLPVPKRLRWSIVAPPQSSVKSLISSAIDVGRFDLKALAAKTDPDRRKHDQYVKIAQAIESFKDDRTGKNFGDATEWGPNRALVIDGLTGLCDAALASVIGGKVTVDMMDWQIAQNMVKRFVKMLTDSCKCHFVLIAHVDRETDQILGGVKLMPKALGKALAPLLPLGFSDVILTVREGTTWRWDTASSQADVKTRNLPIKSDNKPSFELIINKWRARNEAGIIEEQEEQEMKSDKPNEGEK
jgi:AAA domain